MRIVNILGIIVGLCLFMMGMKIMSLGLSELTNEKMRYMLNTLTDQKWKAIICGSVMTALIQSSSAMMIMMIGLMNAHILPLQNAIWIILGAEIGTTMTSQMIALDFGSLAPIIAVLGVIFYILPLSSTYHKLGQSMCGIGLLFMGLEIMTLSMEWLKDISYFHILTTYLSHPLFALVMGMILTTLIQSSSASMGILQSLGKNQLISFHQGAFMILGFNIGTCITGFLASLSSCYNAKRLAFFQIIYNVFGTVLFFILSLTTPLLDVVASFTLSLVNQFANYHTIFNVITTLIVIFIDRYFIQVIYYFLPLREDE